MINIAVFDKGEFIREAPGRLYRECPDGTTGVVFNKKVYPLIDESKIDISSNYFEKEDCPIIYKPKSALAKSEKLEVPFEWYLETNKFGHYIVLDGDTQLFESILNLFDYHNLPWIRADESSRQAPNGKQYDWFIRLESKEEREKVLNDINVIFEEFNTVLIPSSSELELLVEEQKQKINEYKLVNNEFRNEVKELNMKLNSSNLNIQIVKEELSKLNEIKNENVTELDENSRLENLLEEYVEMAQEVMDENLMHNQHIEKLESEIKASKINVIKTANIRYKKINLLTLFFESAYPTVLFTANCFAIIADNFTSFSSLCHQLNLLINNTSNFKKRKIKGTKNWWEANSHISTGVDNTGRVYIKYLENKKDYKYEINIRMKKTQKDDIEQLIKND